MTEQWYTLLSYWQDVEMRHSLTFPFLIGALRAPIGVTAGFEGRGTKELGALVSSMREHEAKDYILHVYHCPDRDKLVITRVKTTSSPSYGTDIPPNSGKNAVLYYTPHGKSPDGVVSAASLVSDIWRECADAVENGLFSCRGKTFQQFDANERKFIRAALA